MSDPQDGAPDPDGPADAQTGAGPGSPDTTPPPTLGAAPPPTSALNTQIVQAVDKTNDILMSAAGPEAAGIAYQKVAQAAAFSVQDATDYFRNIMTMAAAAQGVCLQLMIAKETTTPYTDIMTAAQNAVAAAQTNTSDTGTAAATTMGAFPSQ